MDREHELTAVLADQTRYRIYRAIAQQAGTPVTVAEVAARFGLHPNVARMHLGKLEQAGFVTTGFRRGKGGGRPAKLYSLSDKVPSFGFPPRRYELLSSLALAVLADEDGQRAGRARLRRGRQGRGAALAARGGRRQAAEPGQGSRGGADRSPRSRVCCRSSPGTATSCRSPCTTASSVSSRERGRTSSAPCTEPFSQGIVSVVMAGFGEATFAAADESISRGADCCRLSCTFGKGSGR